MALLLQEYRSKREKTRHTAQPVLDCGTRSLAEAVARIHDGDRVIRFTGVCTGPVVIGTERVTLQSVAAQ
jgi:pyridoxal biosynthesis lyase PdxS